MIFYIFSSFLLSLPVFLSRSRRLVSDTALMAVSHIVSEQTSSLIPTNYTSSPFFLPRLWTRKSLFCVWSRCAKYLHECPEAFSPHQLQMLTAFVWMCGSYPDRLPSCVLTWTTEWSVFSRAAVVFLKSRYARLPFLTHTINRNFVAAHLPKFRRERLCVCVLFPFYFEKLDMLKKKWK